MPQALITAIAEWLVAEGVTATVATVVATVVVDAVASFALGKIAQALAHSQSDDLGAPPSFESVHAPRATKLVPADVEGIAFSPGALGGFQSTAAKSWRVVGFVDHEKGADYFDQ